MTRLSGVESSAASYRLRPDENGYGGWPQWQDLEQAKRGRVERRDGGWRKGDELHVTPLLATL
jgi:hypothetical protein